MKKKITAFVLAAAMVLTLLPATAFAATDPISYLDCDVNGQNWQTKTIYLSNITEVTAGTTTLDANINGGWYYVEGNVSTGTLAVTGDVHLILLNGCDLTVNGTSGGAGIQVETGNCLTVYAQSDVVGTMGALSATGDGDGAGAGGAGIGGGGGGGNSGIITINGGNITAQGGIGDGAGIGGGGGGITTTGGAGTVIINGGYINATGDDDGAGIGGGGGHSDGTGNVTINGGYINATGDDGAGIGGGDGTITINGGTVNAQVGYWSVKAGIGGGDNTIIINGGTVNAQGGGIGGAGIGGNAAGIGSSGSTITINGGNITAYGGNAGAGIGSNNNGYPCTITINDGNIIAYGGSSGNSSGGGAGIGGGAISYSQVAINGGNITAYGGDGVSISGGGGGAGIGGGGGTDSIGSGGGSGYVVITGGYITALGGDSTNFGGGAGIGGGGGGVGGAGGDVIRVDISGGVIADAQGGAGRRGNGANVGNGGGNNVTGMPAIPVINATAGVGGSISPNGSTLLPSSPNSTTYTITTDFGYQIAQVIVDGVDETAAVMSNGNTYTFTNVTADHAIAATFAAVAPAPSGGHSGGSAPSTPNSAFTGGSVYTKGSGINLVHTTQKAFSGFNNVRVDSRVLTKDKQFKVENGSTVVTLFADYLETLDIGEHKLEVYFNDGTIATNSFTVEAVGRDALGATPSARRSTTC